MITIKNATQKDISQIMIIERESFIPQIQESQDVFLERIKTCPETFFIFCDESNQSEIIGYICGEFLDKFPQSPEELKLNHLPQKNTSKNFFYISSFAIKKNRRGTDLGKKLWNESLNKFTENSKIEKIILLVNKEWENARHIYEKSGFIQTAIFKNFFPTETMSFTDGILMEKKVI